MKKVCDDENVALFFCRVLRRLLLRKRLASFFIPHLAPANAPTFPKANPALATFAN